MLKEDAIKLLMFLSKLEGFARGTHKNEMLPDDMWEEMTQVSDMLVDYIKREDDD